MRDTASVGFSDVSLENLRSVTGAVQQLNVGYFWMLVNCLTSAAYVSFILKQYVSSS